MAIKAVLEELSETPYLEYKTIHVAGTNGKGSVSVKIASALESSGLQVGLFISPHIETVEERISINGHQIELGEYTKYSEWIETVANKIGCKLHFFERLVLIAFFYFKDREVDLVVFEVGIGGRRDSTNIIEPILTIITSISLDHTELLGHDIEQIAYEKAGIIKAHVPLVIGPKAALYPIMKRAVELEASLYFTYCKNVKSVDEENSSIALAAVDILRERYNIVGSQFLKSRLPYRYERKKIGVLDFVFDMAHNEDGLVRLFKQIEIDYKDRELSVIFGVKKEKGVETMLKIVNQYCKRLYFMSTPLCHSIEELIKINRGGKEANLTQIVAEARRSSVIVVCGSAYIMSRVKNSIKRL